MSSISDVAGQKQLVEAEISSPFVLRKVQSNKALAARLAPHQIAAEEDGGDAINDPLIRGLSQRLPSTGSAWSLEDRARWLRTAASIFNLVYTAQGEEKREITIGVDDRWRATRRRLLVSLTQCD